GASRYAHAEPRVLWAQTSTPGQLILQVRAEDRIGLLSRLAAAFADCGVDVRWAKVVTMGAWVGDAFCLDLGADTGQGRRAAVEKAVLAVVPQPEPRKPEPEAKS